MSDRLLKESDVLREVENLFVSSETRHLNDIEYGNNQALYHIIDRIEDLPSAGRPQGEWIRDGHHIRCKECGACFCDKDREGDVYPQNFCPNCGADMRGGKDD